MSDKTLGKARGLNTIADPRDFKGASGRRRVAPPRPAPEPPVATEPEPPAAREPVVERPPPEAAPVPTPAPVPAPASADAPAAATPRRAVTPGLQRKRRELSIPHKVADALERTGINPADVVMSGYRKHSDAIYAGAGGRLAAKGRTRLRLSISDSEFEQLTRLGAARGWNRSETVSVILAMELLTPPEPVPAT